MTKAFLVNPFRQFAKRVIESFRFGQDKATQDFIEYVLNTAENRKRQIEAGERFWRAQLGHDDIVSVGFEHGDWAYDSIRPHTIERMTPSSSFVGSGRANPSKIAYWYGATDSETAVAEMRPWQGAVLTVAELRAARNLQVVDCGSNGPMLMPSDPVSEPRRERFVWNSIGEAFSRPVAPTTSDVEYVPTQIIAEVLRVKGFDGILYKSHLGEGMNVVAFELSAFAVGDCQLWTANRVKYELECHGEEMREY